MSKTNMQRSGHSDGASVTSLVSPAVQCRFGCPHV